MHRFPNMVMIGGNSRNAGKTSLACSLIRKLSATHPVVGVKVTSIRPGEEKWHGQHNKEEVISGFTITEEYDPGTRKDTAKMLMAGASRVFYIQAEDAFAEQAILTFRSEFIKNELIVCESRSLRNIIMPGLFIMMLRASENDIQKLVEFYLDTADIVFNYAEQQYEIQQFVNTLYFRDGLFRLENKRFEE